MPMEDPCDFAVEMLPGVDGLCIVFPGGIEICAQVPTAAPGSGLQFAKQLIAQASAILAPLSPIFNIIEIMQALKKLSEALTDALGPPPDPTILAEAIEELVSKIDKVLKLVPQLTVPLMIVGIIDTIIQSLDGLVAELEALVEGLQRIEVGKGLVAEVPSLQCVIDAAEISMQSQFDALGTALALLNPFFSLVNQFCELVGLPELPLPDDMDPEDLEGSVQTLRDLVNTLAKIRDSIPV